MASDAKPQPIVVTHERGKRFLARIRSHVLSVDQPVAGGGDDSAPMPLELMGASLGTCVALYVQQFLRARGLSHAGLRVEVEQGMARDPYRIAEFTVRVVLPDGVPPEYTELLERVARSCPAHHTLTHAARVAVMIDAPVRAHHAERF